MCTHRRGHTCKHTYVGTHTGAHTCMHAQMDKNGHHACKGTHTWMCAHDADVHILTRVHTQESVFCALQRDDRITFSPVSLRTSSNLGKIPGVVVTLRLQINETKTTNPTEQHHLVVAAGQGKKWAASFLGEGFCLEPLLRWADINCNHPFFPQGRRGWELGAGAQAPFYLGVVGCSGLEPHPFPPTLAPDGPGVTWALSPALGVLGSLFSPWTSLASSVKWDHYTCSPVSRASYPALRPL